MYTGQASNYILNWEIIFYHIITGLDLFWHFRNLSAQGKNSAIWQSGREEKFKIWIVFQPVQGSGQGFSFFYARDADYCYIQLPICPLQRHITSLRAIWDPQGKLLFHFLCVAQLAMVKRLSLRMQHSLKSSRSQKKNKVMLSHLVDDVVKVHLRWYSPGSTENESCWIMLKTAKKRLRFWSSQSGTKPECRTCWQSFVSSG